MIPSTFSMLTCLAALAAAFVLGKELERKELAPASFAARVLAPTALCAFVGAKLVGFLDAYAVHGDEAWSYFLHGSGHSFYGVLVFGTLALLAQAWRARIPFGGFLDALAPALFVGYAIGRIGCHLAGDGCYGVPSSLPWAMSYPHGLVPTLERVHPTPLYESLAASLGFVLLWRLRRRERPTGSLFALGLALYGIERFAVEFVRLNPRYGPFSQAQWISILAVVAGASFLAVRGRGERVGFVAKLAGVLAALTLTGGCAREVTVESLEGGSGVHVKEPGFELQAEEIHLEGKHARITELRVQPGAGAGPIRGLTLTLFLDRNLDQRYEPPGEIGVVHEYEPEDGRIHIDHWTSEVDGPVGEPVFLMTVHAAAADHVLRLRE